MLFFFFFLMIRRPPRSTQGVSSAASDVYKRQIVVNAASEAIGMSSEEENRYHKDLARFVKEKLDKELGGTWHVIVGTHFGAQITNESHKMIFFRLEHLCFLIFKH
eukprot:TRINITY_DN13563_c0_g3_i2.p1 TRINITY_DN13563_c0_g3~~TRINITY_DN13563_c0_g3_i2.p1  ORF type:complete len:106 (-),score=31.13 TRINITY_DN13563_c0_g3_i2:191-508(-)